MQAIETRIIPCTNFLPTRIKAECARGSLTVSYDSLPNGTLSGEGAHISAARLLCERFAQEDAKHYGSDQAKNPWLRPLTTGTLKNGNYVHVFTP